jgi:large exoprotein involved in heme utilization and adhesion
MRLLPKIHLHKFRSKAPGLFVAPAARQMFAVLLASAFLSQQTLQAAPPPIMPSGGAFTAGAGSIAKSGNAVVINQASLRGVIDWNSFSIGQGGTVTFKNGSGATLNRVNGGQMSSILAH